MDKNMSRNQQQQNMQMSSMVGGGVPKQQHRPPISHREAINQHEELIKYIEDAWQKVTPGAKFYESPHHEPRMPDFIPFDLDSWWGRRVVHNIHNSRGHQ